MGIFCGKICRCKNGCKSAFAFSPEAIEGCKADCKATRGMTDPYEWLESQPDPVQDFYYAEPAAADLLVNTSEDPNGISPTLMIIGAIILILMSYLILKRS